MGKLIFAILLGALIYLLLRARRQGGRADRSTESPQRVEAMAECTVCRLHVPRSEGIQVNGRFYCCEEHRRLGGG